MTDDRRRRDELGGAETTPAPGAQTPDAPLPHAATHAAGSGAPIAGGSAIVAPAGSPASFASGELGPGSRLGRFVLGERLGVGGMGLVFAGEDRELGRAVAIKVVRSDAEHPAYRARLLREAQAMARLEHRNVVRVYEVGTDAGRLFIAMELVTGETLTQWQLRPRPWVEVAAMFAQIGSGLAAVHRAGLVHRDFKPDNVLVDRDGVARVADFGLARLDREEASPLGAPLTNTGVMMGTPGYMAPEQQLGSGVDARADQYSFCVALREALGGRPLDHARWDAVPTTLRAVVTRGLSYDPEERFESIEDLLAALSAEHVAPPPRRRRVRAAAIAVAVVAAAVTAVVVIARGRNADRSVDRVAAETPIGAATAGAFDASSAAVTAVAAPDPPRSIDDAGAGEVAPSDAPAMAVTRGHGRHDAGVAALRGRDAGVRLAITHDDAPRDTVAVASPPTSVPADAGLHVSVPGTKHLPAAVVGDPAHLPVVRATIHDLGYDGITFDRPLDQLAVALEAEISASSGSDAAIARTKLAMVKRRTGDCSGALALWQVASDVLRPHVSSAEWAARASIGIALCELGQGDAEAAFNASKFGWVHGNRDVVQLIMAIATYDMPNAGPRNKDVALALFITASHAKDPTVQAALQIWWERTGLSLPP